MPRLRRCKLQMYLCRRRPVAVLLNTQIVALRIRVSVIITTQTRLLLRVSMLRMQSAMYLSTATQSLCSQVTRIQAV